MKLVVTLIEIGIIVLLILAALYLLLILPGMRKKPDMTLFKEWLYAHRGLHDNSSDAPENTMPAFAKAMEAGFGIELDIQLTKDKVPVVFHDFTLQRMCGVNGKVEDYTFEQLQEFVIAGTSQRIPKFTDVLELVNGSVPLIVEFKIEGTDLSLCPIADEILRNYNGMYCMESFNPLGVYWYRKNHPEVVRGQLADAFMRGTEYHGVLYFALQHLLFNALTKPDFIAYNHKHADVLSRRICYRLFHNTAVCWTIKSEEELAAAREQFEIFIFDSFVPAQGGREKLHQEMG